RLSLSCPTRRSSDLAGPLPAFFFTLACLQAGCDRNGHGFQGILEPAGKNQRGRCMKQTIYIDMLILVNLLVNYFLLLSVRGFLQDRKSTRLNSSHVS